MFWGPGKDRKKTCPGPSCMLLVEVLSNLVFFGPVAKHLGTLKLSVFWIFLRYLVYRQGVPAASWCLKQCPGQIVISHRALQDVKKVALCCGRVLASSWPLHGPHRPQAGPLTVDWGGPEAALTVLVTVPQPCQFLRGAQRPRFLRVVGVPGPIPSGQSETLGGGGAPQVNPLYPLGGEPSHLQSQPETLGSNFIDLKKSGKTGISVEYQF